MQFTPKLLYNSGPVRNPHKSKWFQMYQYIIDHLGHCKGGNFNIFIWAKLGVRVKSYAFLSLFSLPRCYDAR